MRPTRRQFGRFLAVVSGLVLLAGTAGEARATFYGYAVQQTSGYTFGGATVGTITPLTSTSAAQIANVSGSEAHTGTLDALQSYVGPNPRPAENTFTPLGQVNPDYVRGDALLTNAPAAFTTNNVAEGFLANFGNSAGSGSWAVSAPITVTAAGAVSLAFNYTNQVTLINTGSPFPGVVAADFGYTFTIQNAAGTTVFTSSPDALNVNRSLTAVGSISSPGSGTISITSGTLAVGTYTATITGSEHVFINAVPEPGSLALTFIGVGLLAGTGLRRRHRAQA